jgi:nanoRNase/pAp phosphatase (c-di-AMP/oligoRNAs hydrolase)
MSKEWSNSLTFVLTLLSRSGGFRGHRLYWILEGGHAMAAGLRIDSEEAGDRLRGSSS